MYIYIYMYNIYMWKWKRTAVQSPSPPVGVQRVTESDVMGDWLTALWLCQWLTDSVCSQSTMVENTTTATEQELCIVQASYHNSEKQKGKDLVNLVRVPGASIPEFIR